MPDAEYECTGQSARVVLRQILPTLRALWYGGTVILNARSVGGALLIDRPHSLIHSTTIVGGVMNIHPDVRPVDGIDGTAPNDGSDDA